MSPFLTTHHTPLNYTTIQTLNYTTTHTNPELGLCLFMQFHVATLPPPPPRETVVPENDLPNRNPNLTLTLTCGGGVAHIIPHHLHFGKMRKEKAQKSISVGGSNPPSIGC